MHDRSLKQEFHTQAGHEIAWLWLGMTGRYSDGRDGGPRPMQTALVGITTSPGGDRVRPAAKSHLVVSSAEHMSYEASPARPGRMRDSVRMPPACGGQPLIETSGRRPRTPWLLGVAW